MKYILKYETNKIPGPLAMGEASLISLLLFENKHDDLWLADNIPSTVSTNACEIRLYSYGEINELIAFLNSGGIIQLVDNIKDEAMFKDSGTTKIMMDKYKYEITEFITKTAKEAKDKGHAYGLGIAL